jgi:uncharacterized Zn finger protein
MPENRLMEQLGEALAQQLTEQDAAVILKRGWQYYTDGQVNSVNAGGHDQIYGVVQGSDLYAVILDGGQFRYSSCTCPYPGFCKHMAAVYLQYVQQQGGHVQAERAYFRLLGLKMAGTLVSKQQQPQQVPPIQKAHQEQSAQAQPGEDASAEEWLDWMNRTYGEMWQKCRHSLHALQPVLTSLKSLSRDWPKRLQRLHWSLSIIFVLEQAERAITTVDSFSRYYHEMSFSRMAEPWVEHLYTLISELEPLELDMTEEAWSDRLTALVKARAARGEAQLFDWGYIYLALCEKLSENRSWYERELGSLLELTDAEAGGAASSFLHAAIGILYFLDGRDELALEHFAITGFERSQRIMYPCAAQRMEEEKWELVELWMSFLFERVDKVKNARTVGPFLTLCRRADLDRPDLPVWQAYMTQLLPHSFQDLSDHLLDQQRYEDWADLQLLIGASPQDVGAAALRDIGKQAPHVLLPLYHQAVEASIQTRNRQGYKTAVNQLKKLERLYKADKNTERWERFVAGLVQKHQRLRAFQEELWKGKIIT